MSDNKTLEVKYKQKFYVIIVNRFGITKYISKEATFNHGFLYTVKLHKARKFRNEEMARRFISKFLENNEHYTDISNPQIVECTLTEEKGDVV